MLTVETTPKRLVENLSQLSDHVNALENFKQEVTGPVQDLQKRIGLARPGKHLGG